MGPRGLERQVAAIRRIILEHPPAVTGCEKSGHTEFDRKNVGQRWISVKIADVYGTKYLLNRWCVGYRWYRSVCWLREVLTSVMKAVASSSALQLFRFTTVCNFRMKEVRKSIQRDKMISLKTTSCEWRFRRHLQSPTRLVREFVENCVSAQYCHCKYVLQKCVT